VVPGDGPDVVAARLDRALVEPVCGALDEEGIRYRLEDHLVPQFGLGAATFGVILWVAESQAPAAREIVDDVSAGLSLTDETTGTPDVAAGEGPEAGRGDRPRRDEDDSEEGDADDHRLSRRAISVRLARWTLLGLAAWSSVWAALGWSAGYRGPAVVLLVFAVPPLVLWWISRRAPRGAFTAAAILGAGLLVLEVVTGLVVPDARAEPGLVFGTAFFVVSMVWVVQRLSRARR